MSMEQWWNDTDRGKLKYWEYILSHCHTFPNKSILPSAVREEQLTPSELSPIAPEPSS